MSQFVISDGTAVRLSEIIAVHMDGKGRCIVFLKAGLWIEVSYNMYRRLLSTVNDN